MTFYTAAHAGMWSVNSMTRKTQTSQQSKGASVNPEALLPPAGHDHYLFEPFLWTHLKHCWCERGSRQWGAAEIHGGEVRGSDEQSWWAEVQDFGGLACLSWALGADCGAAAHWGGTGFSVQHAGLISRQDNAALHLLLKDRFSVFLWHIQTTTQPRQRELEQESIVTLVGMLIPFNFIYKISSLNWCLLFSISSTFHYMERYLSGVPRQKDIF